MLVSFSIENFRSFDSEQTLSFVASPRTTGHDDHLHPIPGTQLSLLPAAVIYGANGAGKSNIFQALRRLKQLIEVGVGPKEPILRTRFLFKEDNDKKPTGFTVRLLLRGTLFEYGCSFDESEVAEEWLTILVGEERRDVFVRASRESDVSIDAGPGFQRGQGTDKLEALMKVSVRRNQLFLAAAREALERSDQGPQIGLVIEWFVDGLMLIGPETRFRSLLQVVQDDDAFRAFLVTLLQGASTGVVGVNVDASALQGQTWNEVFKAMSPGGGNVAPIRDGHELEKVGDDAYRMRWMSAQHSCEDGRVRELPFGDESDGTRRLAHLAPALFGLHKTPTTCVIDELDRSLHPVLSKKFLELFVAECRGGRGQIMVTTHETHLLDLEILRRDEIWFVEKNTCGASEMYPLSDFKVRKDLEVGRNYLQGRFGAIPFVGGLDKLGPASTDGESPTQ